MPIPETVHLTDDQWTCLCGNEPHTDGFYAYMPDPPREVEPTPHDWTSNAYFCLACLRVFNVTTGIVIEQPDTIAALEGNPYTRTR